VKRILKARGSKTKDLKLKLAFSGAFNLIKYAPEKFAGMAFNRTDEVHADLVGVAEVNARLEQHSVTYDLPEPMFGTDKGINPMEAYLAGGLSCFLGTHFLYGYPMGVKIEQAWVDAEGDWDLRGVFGTDGPPGFSEIRITTHIVGSEQPEDYQELFELAQHRSPGYHLILDPLNVLTTLDVTEVKLHEEAEGLKEFMKASAERFSRNPQSAKRTEKIHTEWIVDGFGMNVKLGRHSLRIDEAKPLGTGLGPNPTRVQFAALASCMAQTFRYTAARLGVKFHRLSVDIEADLDFRGTLGVPGISVPYSEIRITLHVAGSESPDRYRELLEEVKKCSPVYNTAIHGVNAVAELEIMKTTGRLEVETAS
jgi:uncharacterized OsmC-like protein